MAMARGAAALALADSIGDGDGVAEGSVQGLDTICAEKVDIPSKKVGPRNLKPAVSVKGTLKQAFSLTGPVAKTASPVHAALDP